MLLAVLALLIAGTNVVFGHGRMQDPPARSTMWRFGFSNPTNYDDTQLNCGGMWKQFGSNGGRCGVCGDPYQHHQPRANEGGGRYGNGIITRAYRKGGRLSVLLEITANHEGHFEFSICPHNNPSQPADEACFQQNILQFDDGSGTRWRLEPGVRHLSLDLRLPDHLTCSQCILRWKWRCGNNWGEENGMSGRGLGNQEHFFGCSDIEITEDGAPASYTASRGNNMAVHGPYRSIWDAHNNRGWASVITSNTHSFQNEPLNTGGGNSVGSYQHTGGSQQRPEQLPNNEQQHVETLPPIDFNTCQPVGIWVGVDNMIMWCRTNCAAGNCPSNYCCCGSSC